MFSGLINPTVAIFNTLLHFQALQLLRKTNGSEKTIIIIFASVRLDTMDFSSMTLTQIKRQEMDAQVRTLLVQENKQSHLHTCNTANLPRCGINEEISDFNERIWFGWLTFDWLAEVGGASLWLVMGRARVCVCVSGARLGAGDAAAKGARAPRRAEEEAL